MEKKVNPHDIKDRIVLVGATDPLIHDEYPTPLGVSPGVMIIANSLIMLLSERFLYIASTGQNFLLTFLFGLPVIFVNRRFRFLPNTVFTLLFLISAYIFFVYLRARGFHFSYLSIFFSGIMAYLVPNLYKYLNLLYMSNHLKNRAIMDPLTGFYSLRYFLLQLDEKLKSKENLVFVAIRMGSYKHLSLRLNFDQIKLLSRLFGEHSRSRVENQFKKSIYSRISNDTLGIVIEGVEKEKIEPFFRTFFRGNKGVGLGNRR